jgi:N-acetyl-anhydromuramyl-L-alanine amidase AmpD
VALVTPNPHIQFLILHCSNSLPSQDLSAEDLARQHRSQGCLSIKYHFVIRRDGSVETGRALNQIGLHANKQYNAKSIGICLVGGKGKDGKPEANYTEAQYEALVRVITQLEDTFPQAKVVGWNELSQSPNETCPNFDVQEWLAQL